MPTQKEIEEICVDLVSADTAKQIFKELDEIFYDTIFSNVVSKKYDALKTKYKVD